MQVVENNSYNLTLTWLPPITSNGDLINYVSILTTVGAEEPISLSRNLTNNTLSMAWAHVDGCGSYVATVQAVTAPSILKRGGGVGPVISLMLETPPTGALVCVCV
ncbi:unnamed protein product [Protopolystoma xenopodis]|uniref:Fibronectin type-III domain-containing protein n=1 Tax=Protopolystoma xenopodis TaxID=117903 RepID=A0A448WXS8_9PLAT|nr:unnamed protein product [Protopolystoma xenopodis]